MSVLTKIADHSADLLEDAVEKASDAVAATASNVAGFIENAGEGASQAIKHAGEGAVERLTPEPEHRVVALLGTGKVAVAGAAKATKHAAEGLADHASDALHSAGEFIDEGSGKLAHVGGGLAAAVVHHGQSVEIPAVPGLEIVEDAARKGHRFLIATGAVATALAAGAGIAKWRQHHAAQLATAQEEAESELAELAEEAAAELSYEADEAEIAETADSIADAVEEANADPNPEVEPQDLVTDEVAEFSDGQSS
ncbi:MAG: hypothetical protein ACOYEV_13455 [Candidatus Nanopelagicales bacterium]